MPTPIESYLADSHVVSPDESFPRDRGIRRRLEVVDAQGSFTAEVVTADEVQSIAIYSGSITGGTFELDFELASGETFTTAAIAYNANAATIESAIDAAATAAAVAGWTNGDISVAGGDLTTAPVTLTFDGTSVTGQNHVLTVIDGASLTGGVNEVQSIAIYSGTVAGGTFELDIELSGGSTFSTAPIAYNANAATIETAIDVAATAAAVPGWTNGDISVSGGDLTTAPVVLTFDGSSVEKGNHVLTVVDGALLEGRDEVQQSATHGETGGTYELDFTLADATTFSTAPIAFNAPFATIESAIDTAATAAAVTGWTNGDISVSGSGTGMHDGTVDFTFDGASVEQANHSLIVVDGALLTPGATSPTVTETTAGAVAGTPGTVTETTPGAPLGSVGAVSTSPQGGGNRPAYDILFRMGILTGTIPAEGVVPTAIEPGQGFYQRRLRRDDIKKMALDIAIQEGNDAIYDAILDALGIV